MSGGSTSAAAAVADPQLLAAAYGMVHDLIEANEVSRFVAEGAELMSTIIAGVAGPASPVNVRVKCLGIIGDYSGLFDTNIVRKATASIVKVISGEDNTVPLLLAAVQAIERICSKASPELADAVARDAVDVLLQVYLDEASFPALVRQAAIETGKRLTRRHFRSVTLRLVQWMADERAEDDADVIARERALALDILAETMSSTAFVSTLNEGLQRHLLQIVAGTFATVTADEFGRLMAILTRLPVVQQSQCKELLELVVSKARPNMRGFETVCIAARFVPQGTKCDAITTFLINDLYRMAENAEGVWMAKAMVVAARAATAASAEKLFTEAALRLDLFAPVVPGQLPTNLTQIEALMMVIATLAVQCGASYLRLTSDQTFQQRLETLRGAVAATLPLVSFAVKKAIGDGSATQELALVRTCLSNVAELCAQFVSRRLPTVAKASWERPSELPAVAKRKRDDGSDAQKPPLPAVAQAPPGTASTLGADAKGPSPAPAAQPTAAPAASTPQRPRVESMSSAAPSPVARNASQPNNQPGSNNDRRNAESQPAASERTAGDDNVSEQGSNGAGGSGANRKDQSKRGGKHWSSDKGGKGRRRGARR